jgi:RHS repeat-associated protein
MHAVRRLVAQTLPRLLLVFAASAAVAQVAHTASSLTALVPALIPPINTCPPKPPADPCEILTCESGEWISSYEAVGTACNDGDACTSGDTCDSAGTCVGTPSVCGPPGAITGPATSESGSYTLSWTAPPGSVTSYVVAENGTLLPAVTTTSMSFSGKKGGRYSYRVTACLGPSCGPYGPVFAVDVLSSLTTNVADAAVPATTTLAQGWVGSIPGKAGVDGGAATYRIDVEVPPGRAAMQPSVALTYGSRSGNGVAGVGWSLSAAGSIYRCPRTYEQDGASSPVQLTGRDRLCYDGQRLMGPADPVYGTAGSEYRTEVESFARITLQGDMASSASYFVVEHKSGQVSVYTASPANGSGTPARWLLAMQYDRQDNCIGYDYQLFNSRTGVTGGEWVLAKIRYTGTRASATQCTTSATSRAVQFVYEDRPDRRTTFTAGTAEMQTSRLAAITTSVGAAPVRRYQMGYKNALGVDQPSGATGRTLLRSVQLCAGSVCDGTRQFPPTVFTYQEQGADFPQAEQFSIPAPLYDGSYNWTWAVGLAGDLNGDGRPDLVFQHPYPGTNRSSYLSLDGGATVSLLPVTWTTPFDLLFDMNPMGAFTDFTNDGRVDLVGTVGGALAFASYSGAGWGIVKAVKDSSVGGDLYLPASGSTAHEGRDFDGDGLPDLVRSDGSGTFIHRQTAPLRFEETASITEPAVPYYQPISQTRDFNGDGYSDLFHDSTTRAAGMAAYIDFFQGPGKSPAFVPFTLAALGGPSTTFLESPGRRWIDVNGDGLPDIYEPGSIWINRGGPPGPGMFRRFDVRGSAAIPVKRGEIAVTADFDADGREELIVPTTRTGPTYCSWTLGTQNTREREACGDQHDTTLGIGLPDRSIFKWEAYRFVEATDGSYDMVRVPTSIVAPYETIAPLLLRDWNGDGLVDVVYRLNMTYVHTGNGNVATGEYVDLADGAYGTYRSWNTAKAPDLLVSATTSAGGPDRSANVTTWAHQPLSNSTMRAECQQTTEPFYRANHDAVGRKYGDVHFTSSMWAVAAMETSHGEWATTANPSATNRTCYRYEDAMLNTLGRGFLGFRKIVAEEALPPAVGETGTGLFSANNLRTTTEFNQEFPFTNTVRRVTIEGVLDGKKVGETVNWWHGVQSGTGGSWVVYPTATTETKYDADGATLLATTSSVTELDLVSGEAAKTCSVANDTGAAAIYGTLPASVTATPITITQETRTLVNDLPNWWLGKATTSTASSDQFAGATDLGGTRQPTTYWGILGWGSGQVQKFDVPVPCPPDSPTVMAKTRFTEFDWYTATEFVSQRRKAKTQAVRPLGAAETEVETSYTYGSYGNLLYKTVKARGVLDAIGNRLAQTTTYGLSADGYFIETERNALGHVATSRRDAATGQVTWQQDIQGGPTTTTTLDAMGRPLSSVRDGTQAVSYRTVACAALLAPGNLPCAPLDILARQTTQAGAPTRTEYLDLLGRVTRTATVALDGSLVVTEVEFSERGLKVAEHAPRVDGAQAWATTYSGFDRLGRPGKKEVQRSASIFAGGPDSGPLITTYVYAGHLTSITADQGGPVPLSMSRTFDARGRLVVTTQQVKTPAPHPVTVKYVYEPAGNLTHIVDSADNDLSAEYDALGRKTKVIDPDRGTWLYGWDGLGRLQFQTDAKGQVTTQEYDVIGRPIHRSVTSGGNNSPAQAFWDYDLAGGLGLLGRETDSDGFVREYGYDSLKRPNKLTTTIPAADTKQPSGTRVFTMEYGYDRGLGRLKAMRYPSAVNPGEMVALEYDTHGYPLGETALNADYSRGKQYRRVLAMSERGRVIDQQLGNEVRETSEYDPSTGLALTLTAILNPPPPPPTWPPISIMAISPITDGVTLGVSLVRQDTYLYDRFLNLALQTKNITRLQREERFTYDELQRLTSAGRCTGAGCMPGTGETDSYTYDDLGNLTSKSDYATSYLYGSSTRAIGLAGPHAVNQVSKTVGGTATFTYDANGNMLTGDGRQIGFDLTDRPVRVVMAGTTTDFAYGPSGGRYRQKITGAPGTGFGPKTVYYVDKEYELTVWDTGSASPGRLEERTFIGGSVVALTSQSAAGVTTREVRYQHLDRLGSPEAVTRDDLYATLVEAHGFDPWGKPRGGSWLPSGERLHPGGEPGTTSTRGFTGHEQLDASYLTHMNGRMYDYRLGRFLSVDPIISNPANSQSINPYSYIGNNPLSGTDPTGYQAAADDNQSHGGGPVGRSPGEERGSILGKIKDALDSGLVSAKTTMAEVAAKIGVGMDAIAKAFPEAVAKITGGSGGRTTTTQAAGPVQEAGAPKQIATGNAQPPATPVLQPGSTPNGVGGGGASVALALGVGVQADAQVASDGKDAGIMLSIGARAGWNVAVGASPTLLIAPSVPSLSEYLGADPKSFSAGFTPSLGLGVVVAGGSISLAQYSPYCGSGPGSASIVAPVLGISLPGPGFDVGPYVSATAYVYIPMTYMTQRQVENSWMNWGR